MLSGIVLVSLRDAATYRKPELHRDPKPVAALVEPHGVRCPVSTTLFFFPHCLSAFPSPFHLELQQAEMGGGAVTNGL